MTRILPLFSEQVSSTPFREIPAGAGERILAAVNLLSAVGADTGSAGPQSSLLELMRPREEPRGPRISSFIHSTNTDSVIDFASGWAALYGSSTINPSGVNSFLRHGHPSNERERLIDDGSQSISYLELGGFAALYNLASAGSQSSDRRVNSGTLEADDRENQHSHVGFNGSGNVIRQRGTGETDTPPSDQASLATAAGQWLAGAETQLTAVFSDSPETDNTEVPVQRIRANGISQRQSSELLLQILYDRFPSETRLRGIQLSDINQLMLNPNLERDEALMAAFLKRNFQSLVTALHPNGGGTTLTIADFERLARMWRQGENPNLFNRFANYFDSEYARLFCTQALYRCPNCLDSINLAACEQPYDVGNCSLVSSIGALVIANPQAIADMVRDNGNRTCTVTFPGREPITVNRPTLAEIAYYGLSTEDGQWAYVLQSAFGRLRDPNAAMPVEASAHQRLSDCLAILTGGTTTVNSTGMWTRWSTLHNQIQRAIEGHHPVGAVINAEFFAIFGWADNREDSTGLPCQHAYAITAFQPNPENPRESVVTLWNPHGTVRWLNNQVPDGITDLGGGRFRMSLRRFNEIFSQISSVN